jgi:hypothetical protein
VGIGKIGPAGTKYQSQINDIIAKMKSGQIKPPTTLLVTK